MTPGTLTADGAAVLGDAASDAISIGGTIQGTTAALRFEGTPGAAKTLFAFGTPLSDNTITFSDAVSGTVVTTGDTASVTGTMIADNTVAGSDLATNIAISTSGNIQSSGSIQTTGTGSFTSAGEQKKLCGILRD